MAKIGPGARVVEIGPGTGQATQPLAARGSHVVAVELGAHLARVLQRKVAGMPVDVVVSTFEDWPPPIEPFDTFAAFTAWHWLDPAVRAAKAAAILRPGGALATVTTFHVLGGSEAFFSKVQECYERWDPATPPDVRLLSDDDIPPALDEVDRSELFEPAIRRRYRQNITYTTATYLNTLATYSGHRALDPARRQGLFECVARLIDDEYGGEITKAYLYELRVAHTTTRP
nr:class I SAM-dependent methyltransferase [Phytoactinopolyspora alkaliphila]